MGGIIDMPASGAFECEYGLLRRVWKVFGCVGCGVHTVGSWGIGSAAFGGWMVFLGLWPFWAVVWLVFVAGSGAVLVVG